MAKVETGLRTYSRGSREDRPTAEADFDPRAAKEQGSVTKAVTEEGQSVTGTVTSVTEAVTVHECPDCGAKHRVKLAATNAERQRAYRQRRRIGVR